MADSTIRRALLLALVGCSRTSPGGIDDVWIDPSTSAVPPGEDAGFDSGDAIAPADGGSDGSVESGASQDCTVTLSGALTGVARCVAQAGPAGDIARGITFAIDGTLPGGFNFGSGDTWGGVSLDAGTWTMANTLFGTAAAASGPSTWEQKWLSGDAGSATGTFTLTITSPGPEGRSIHGPFYLAPHGSFRATLPPAAGTGAAGDVHVEARF